MINDHGDVKLIDVDSYQVPGIKHTNKLLEEIRDYYSIEALWADTEIRKVN